MVAGLWLRLDPCVVAVIKRDTCDHDMPWLWVECGAARGWAMARAEGLGPPVTGSGKSGPGSRRDIMNKKPTDIMTPDADAGRAVGAIPMQRGKVRDIMTPAPVGVYYSQTVGETARIMRDTQVGAVLV